MFQSLIGRLQTGWETRKSEVCGRLFQSLIGRLQTEVWYEAVCDVQAFQSLIGRLQTKPEGGENDAAA